MAPNRPKKPRPSPRPASPSSWAASPTGRRCATRRSASTISKVPYEAKIVSAHRTPDRLTKFAKGARAAGFKVVIAGAGGAAHLPGMVAAMTTLPVLGVPVETSALKGADSLYSIVQMPAGVPVGTLAIGKAGAANAGLLAAAILATADEALAKRLGGLAARADGGGGGASGRRRCRPAKALPPGSTIGILGGGQLGRMLALAAARLGFRCHVFSPDPVSPAFDVAAKSTVADYGDASVLAAFARAVDVVTYEFENVDVAAVERLAAIVPVRPGAKALAVSQDRFTEKSFLRELGIPTAAFAEVGDRLSLDRAIGTLALPAVLKTRRLGYDGKGQAVIRWADEARYGV